MTFTISALGSTYIAKATQCKQPFSNILEIAIYSVSTALKIIALL
jgi:hypothetical protein